MKIIKTSNNFLFNEVYNKASLTKHNSFMIMSIPEFSAQLQGI